MCSISRYSPSRPQRELLLALHESFVPFTDVTRSHFILVRFSWSNRRCDVTMPLLEGIRCVGNVFQGHRWAGLDYYHGFTVTF